MAQAKRKEKKPVPVSPEAPAQGASPSGSPWEKPAGLTRRGWAIVGAVVLLCNLPIIHFFLLRGHPEATVAVPYADDFSDPATVEQHYFTTGGGLWRVQNGELFSPGVKNNPLWLKAKLPPNVRVEVDARAASPEGDIRVEIFGNGIDHLSGYELVLGGWGNSRSALIRSNGSGDNDPNIPTLEQLTAQARAAGAAAGGPIKQDTAARVDAPGVRAELGKTYHLVVERRGSRLRWTVDGQPLLELDDPFPYQGPDHDRLGLSSAEGDVYYDNLRVTPLDDSAFDGALVPRAPQQGEALPPPGPFDERFPGPALSRDWRPTAPGAVRLEEGALVLQGAQNHPVWLRRPLPDPVAIEFDCWSDSPEGDIKVELFGDGASFHTGELHAAYNATGYVLVMGGWRNTKSEIARLAEHSEDAPSRTDVPVVPGKRYHWRITRKGGQLSWSVDGKPFLDFTDPQPLAGPGHEFFAFSDWETRVHFANLSIRPL